VRGHGRRNMTLAEAGLLSIVLPGVDDSDLAGSACSQRTQAPCARSWTRTEESGHRIFDYETHPVFGLPGPPCRSTDLIPRRVASSTAGSTSYSARLGMHGLGDVRCDRLCEETVPECKVERCDRNREHKRGDQVLGKPQCGTRDARTHHRMSNSHKSGPLNGVQAVKVRYPHDRLAPVHGRQGVEGSRPH
jgi:hypothetical protein